MIKFYLAALIAVLLTGISQIILKKGAQKAIHARSLLASYLNWYSLLAYALFVLVTLLSLFAMKRVQVKEMVIFLPLTYLMVPLMSRLFLHERLNKKQWLGIALVIAGIILFNFDHLLSG